MEDYHGLRMNSPMKLDADEVAPMMVSHSTTTTTTRTTTTTTALTMRNDNDDNEEEEEEESHAAAFSLQHASTRNEMDTQEVTRDASSMMGHHQHHLHFAPSLLLLPSASQFLRPIKKAMKNDEDEELQDTHTLVLVDVNHDMTMISKNKKEGMTSDEPKKESVTALESDITSTTSSHSSNNNNNNNNNKKEDQIVLSTASFHRKRQISSDTDSDEDNKTSNTNISSGGKTDRQPATVTIAAAAAAATTTIVTHKSSSTSSSSSSSGGISTRSSIATTSDMSAKPATIDDGSGTTQPSKTSRSRTNIITPSSLPSSLRSSLPSQQQQQDDDDDQDDQDNDGTIIYHTDDDDDDDYEETSTIATVVTPPIPIQTIDLNPQEEQYDNDYRRRQLQQYQQHHHQHYDMVDDSTMTEVTVSDAFDTIATISSAGGADGSDLSTFYSRDTVEEPTVMGVGIIITNDNVQNHNHNHNHNHTDELQGIPPLPPRRHDSSGTVLHRVKEDEKYEDGASQDSNNHHSHHHPTLHNNNNNNNHKSVQVLNQEAIDLALAENFAINQSNTKEGKKHALEEIVDPTSIIRRSMSRASQDAKGITTTTSTTTVTRAESGGAASFLFGMGGGGAAAAAAGGSDSHIMTNPTSLQQQQSLSSGNVSSSHPAFGNRAVGGLLDHDDDEDDDNDNNHHLQDLDIIMPRAVSSDVEAHAGFPILPRPGAFYVPGIARGESFDNQDIEDFSTLEDYLSRPDDYGGGGGNNNNRNNNDANVDDHEEAAVVPGPTDVRALPRPSGVVVDGQVIMEEDEGGMTEDEQKFERWRWRLCQALYYVGVVIAAGVISLIVVYTRHNDTNGQTPSPAWALIGTDRFGSPLDDNLFFGFTVSLSANGNRFATGVHGLDLSAIQPDVGQVQIFDRQNNNKNSDRLEDNRWAQTATIDFTASNGKAGEALALSKDGRRVIVATPGWTDDLGLIGVYEEVEQNDNDSSSTGDSTWRQVGGEVLGLDDRGRFGSSVDIADNGRIVAASAPFASTGGIVRVYEEVRMNSEEVSQWIQMGQDIGSETVEALLGSSISMSADGQRIAISASNVGIAAGQVTIYDYNGTFWNPVGQTLYGSAEFETFGISVSLNSAGNMLAVGAIGSPGADGRFNSGKAQVFEFNAGTWVQMGEDIQGRGSESLGRSVALSDNGLLAVGSPERPQLDETGQVKVFSFDPIVMAWVQVENKISGVLGGENFGFCVAISSDGKVVGASGPNAGYDGRLNQVGVVRVYENTKPKAALVRGRG